MKEKKNKKGYFSTAELCLWWGSVALIFTFFLLFDRESYLTLSASLIGVTSLIFNAKGNPVGQVLMVIFSIMYGIISFGFAYYGEMITYMGMTLPMAVVALVEWLKNPFKGNRAEVAVNSISKKELLFMLGLTAAVTAVFWFILDYFNTANLVPGTVSVATSFAAAYLTLRRSPWFAFVYGLNDLVLIVLWLLASLEDVSYLSVLVCFAVFFVNDIYGFICWRRMQKRQSAHISA